MPQGPLSDLRVVDFGHHVAGPLASLMLAEQGADVVHVEAPGGSAYSELRDAFLNRSKRRVALDLKSAGDLEIARRLVASADVVIENFRPGVLERLGIDLGSARAADPGLITCSIPGFGRTDPRSGLRGFEGVVQAATGNWQPRAGEEPKGWDWDRPTFSALPIASHIAAYLAATSVVMAAIARRRSSLGQHVEVPLFDAMFTLIGHSGAYVDSAGLRQPRGIHQRGAGAFRCLDGRYVQFDTSSPRHLTWFARAAGLLGSVERDLLDLSRNTDPEVNERLHACLRELFLTRPAAYWEELGNEAGAAMGFVRTPAEWISTEQAVASGAVVHVEDPLLGPLWSAGAPVRLGGFGDQPVAPRHPPGADNGDVLDELDRLGPRLRPEGMENGLEKALSGVRVLDLGLALAAPTCGRILSEFGAEVVKLNAPNAGVGGYLNRGKDSVLVDLDSLEGQEVYWRLVESSDVVVENFSPGTAERLGIGPDEVRARRPEVVYTSISCYGRTGPWARHRGWERQGQAVTGIMERTELPSVLGPYNIVDIGTGILASFGTALALYDRQRSGEGQLVCASLAQTATYHQSSFMFDFADHVPSEPRGYETLGLGPLQRYYQASDGWFFLGARQGDLGALGELTGRSDLGDLPGPELEKVLEGFFASRSASSWAAELDSVGVAAQRAVSVAELMKDETVRARGLSVTQEVEGAGSCTMPGVSPQLSGTPCAPGEPPHRPGSDARHVLEAVGLGERLEHLERAWVVRTADLPPAW